MAKKRKKHIKGYAKRKKSGLYTKAIRIHERRPASSRKRDESRSSKTVRKTYNRNWHKYPNKSDISGIDTKKHKAKSINEVISFLKGNYPEITKIRNTKSLITANIPRISSKQQVLQRSANIRYSNVKISKRKILQMIIE